MKKAASDRADFLFQVAAEVPSLDPKLVNHILQEGAALAKRFHLPGVGYGHCKSCFCALGANGVKVRFLSPLTDPRTQRQYAVASQRAASGVPITSREKWLLTRARPATLRKVSTCQHCGHVVRATVSSEPLVKEQPISEQQETALTKSQKKKIKRKRKLLSTSDSGLGTDFNTSALGSSLTESDISVFSPMSPGSTGLSSTAPSFVAASSTAPRSSAFRFVAASSTAPRSSALSSTTSNTAPKPRLSSEDTPPKLANTACAPRAKSLPLLSPLTTIVKPSVQHTPQSVGKKQKRKKQAHLLQTMLEEDEKRRKTAGGSLLDMFLNS